MARLKLPDSVQDVANLVLSDQLRKNQLEDGTAGSRLGRHYPDERLPTVITTAAHLLENRDDAKERRIINCWANPSNVSWTAPRREAFQKVKAGSVRYSWRKRGRTQGTGSKLSGGSGTTRETYYDELQVQFTFQSGNILAVPGSVNKPLPIGDGESRDKVPPGLDDFYLFLGLLNEQKLLDDGRENWHVIIHTSPVFPSIFMKGWFTPEGVTWAEASDSGFGLQWQATMEVHQTIPAIHNPTALRNMFGSIY